MHIDVAKIDKQIAFLQRETSRLVEIGSPWADRNAALMQEIAKTLRQLRQEKQMTGMDGQRLGEGK
jgi:hypothetical protein